MYDAIIKGIDRFFITSGKDPGMAMIILAGVFYFLDKITKHFNKEKYKNYTLKFGNKGKTNQFDKTTSHETHDN